MKTILRICAVWLAPIIGALAFTAPATAGQLKLQNTSGQPITCTVDGWTVATGYAFDWQIAVQPGETFYVGQNTLRVLPDGQLPTIDWASCGGLTTRLMNITAAGPDGLLVLTGAQTRVLNAALYPYLPTLPGDQFEALVAHVIDTYQAANPQVLLSAQLNMATDIYSFTNLPVLLGAGGLDVVELDTLYLAFLAQSGLINPAQIVGEQPLPVALAAATVDQQLWGVPSWLCMDFLYATDPGVQQITSLAGLLPYLNSLAPVGGPKLIADYNGSWRLPSIYINGYVQNHGYGQIAQALQMPPDPEVIANLVALTDTCAYGGGNNCTNGANHSAENAQNGAIETIFANGDASTELAFSEQSFFMKSANPALNLYVAPGVWGQGPQPLLFSDVFVSSAATCPPQSPCAADATAFTSLMTGLDMKNYIVQARDLPQGTPWRTLLVPLPSFYEQGVVQANPLYPQYARIFGAAEPFPNSFTAALQTEMAFAVCAALKAAQPAYVCKTGAANDNQALPADEVAPAQDAAPARRKGGRS
ncbi:hypothetical protein [Brevundimonas sp.]|jgi:thiamine pyridinylase|uniref:hypothetical protein n=1 Tax=Brevundimonas sp. TaxID=1871086 RepID=UPI0037BF57D5